MTLHAKRSAVLAAAAALALAASACKLTYAPVNLNVVEPSPGGPSIGWSDNYSAGRVSPPAGR